MQFVKSAAWQWYCAERCANPGTFRRYTQGDIYAVAIPRVRAVWAGEVLWADATAGDRAVWKGRARNPLVVGESDDRIKRELAALGLRADHLEYANYYDTLRLMPVGDGTAVRWAHCVVSPPVHKNTVFNLFGNANIGDYAWTNLSVPGQMCGDRGFRIQNLYIDADRDVIAADKITVHAIVGPGPVWTGTLLDALRGVPIDRVVTPRQNFKVQLEVDKLSAEIELVAHLEGVEFSVR